MVLTEFINCTFNFFHRMNPILRNILAVIAGALLGMAVNMAIIMLYPSVFCLPFECPPMSSEDFMPCFIENVHLLELPHLICVFLAHSLGTLIGAFLAAKIGVSKKLGLAFIIGALFFLGGFMMQNDINWTPMNFAVIDLIFAYFPMAWLGWKLADSKK